MLNALTQMKQHYNISFFIVMFCVMLHLQSFAKHQTLPSPNIMCLVSEGNITYIGVYGDTIARTPNIYNLAKTGVVYHKAFANASVYAQSINTIITGMYSNCLGNQQICSEYKAPDFVKLLPQYLKEVGYYTANKAKEDYIICKLSHPCCVDWNESFLTANYKNRKSGQPFCQVVNFGVTHESGLFDTILIEKLRFKPANMVVYPYHLDSPNLRRDYANYYRKISSLDDQIGKIIDELKKEGLYENTVVFYFSDHGGILPVRKRYLYDSSLKVPLIIQVSKMYHHLMPEASGSHSDLMISFIDLSPSLLNLAGI